MTGKKTRTTSIILTRRKHWRLRPQLTLHEVASACDLHPEVVDRFRVLGLIDPLEHVGEQECLFSQEAVGRVRKIMRLRRDLGLNLAGVGVVLDLLEEVESLRRRVRELESHLEGSI